LKIEKITPREAFIYTCLNMISADREIDDRETEKLFEIIRRYGFKKEELEKVIEVVRESGPQNAFEAGLKSVAIARKLDDQMKQNLLHALLEIIEADEKVQDAELDFLEKVKKILNR
jgi:uncharacterized tellurite resistance protein B-like protein